MKLATLTALGFAVAAILGGTASAGLALRQLSLGATPNYSIDDGVGYAASLTVTREAPGLFGSPRYGIRDSSAIRYSNLDGGEDRCEGDLFSGALFQPTRWTCSYVSRLAITLRDLDDRLVALDVDTTFTVDGGTGNDFLQTAQGSDTLRGGSGNDSLLPGANDDVLEGGAGDDLLAGQAGSDTIDGGDGVDTVSYSTSAAGITVTLNGTADDGASGEEDNVTATVERIIGGSRGDRLTGSSTANRLRGNGGNDILRGDGGADQLLGEGGDDRLIGGPGADRLEGGAGADIIDAKGDGSIDTIFCGAGTDVVHADPTDRVDISTCEVVE